MQRFQMSKQSWRKRSMSAADITGELPIYDPASATARRESQSWGARSTIKYKLVHFIPLVVMLCFFILWCYSSPVELETEDGRSNFVPRTKKPPPKEKEATDLDLTVLALESSPDDVLSISDKPTASLALLEHTNVSSSDSYDHNVSLTDSHKPNTSFPVFHNLKAPISVSYGPNASFPIHRQPSASFSDSHNPDELFSDLIEANASLSASYDTEPLSLVSHDPRISSPGTSSEAAPQASKEG